MNAVILVVSHPYYAMTDESGNFKIDWLPHRLPVSLPIATPFFYI
jgi:hypothetical protein